MTEPAPTDDVAALVAALHRYVKGPPKASVIFPPGQARAAAAALERLVTRAALAEAREDLLTADLAAARAEADDVREGYQTGLHQEEDDGRCTCGAEWICPRWAEPSPENYADMAEAAGRLEAERDALRRQVAAVRALLDGWDSTDRPTDVLDRIVAALDTEETP